MTRLLLPIAIVSLFFTACSPAQKIGRSAQRTVLNDSALLTAHVGISVYDADAGKYLYNYQGDKYFVPASNVKIPTCYAAMKYLGDSLVGLRFQEDGDMLLIRPTGDPTFLHPDFKTQKVFDFFMTNEKILWLMQDSLDKIWQENMWGSGWAWNDYDEYYMAERSPMPIYGNAFRVELKGDSLLVTPKFFRNRFLPTLIKGPKKFKLKRPIASNRVEKIEGKGEFKSQIIPIAFNSIHTTFELLNDTLGDIMYTKRIAREQEAASKKRIEYMPMERKSFHPFSVAMSDDGGRINKLKTKLIHSQPTESLLKPMMHRSDNFFAEQSLLMVSNEVLGVMSDEKIIDSILKTDFADLPQKPRWADGSGLSRYNLFTPQDMVAILNKMRQQFGMARIKEIFPTGNEGTLTNYYKSSSGHLFAKTGTLSGVVALSGFLYTRKNKLLLFSVLVNNHQASGTAVRRAVEKFVEGLRNEY